VLALGKTIKGLKPFPTHFGSGLVLPSKTASPIAIQVYPAGFRKLFLVSADDWR
jgi:hypothetical protein